MSAFLKLFGTVCILIGMLHVSLGLEAEQLLGTGLSEATIANPTLDSQNRFYGSIFMLFGAISLLCATDLERYAVLFRLQMGAFFLGGLARLFSILIYGLPSWQVQLLTVSELLLPPVLIWWHAASRRN